MGLRIEGFCEKGKKKLIKPNKAIDKTTITCPIKATIAFLI